MTWGNLALYQSDDERRIRQPLSACWSELLLTRIWAQPQSNGIHAIYNATADLPATG